MASASAVMCASKRVKARKDAVFEPRRVEQRLRRLKNCTVIQGHARFQSSRTVVVNDEVLQADKIFVNVGGRASVPEMSGIHSTTAQSLSPAADVSVCTTRRSTSACPWQDRPSESKKSTTASGWSVLWITISAISIWRKKPCSPCRTPSGQKCNLCLRNVLLPMSPERTRQRMVGSAGLEPATSCL